MGTTSIAVVDLSSFAVTWWEGVGSAPRHLVLSPDGRHLFVTLNTFGEVAKLDARTGEVLARTTTGSAPRSMAIADDGRSLYVVNYLSNTVAKVRAADLEVLQVVPSPDQPIGITYDAASRTVWVAGYSGTIQVLQDAAPD
jgi:DNA-binding beta-propeller fold protein YncE